jgi:tetratricopeptide (TPR) repeat protein/TolB-like protein
LSLQNALAADVEEGFVEPSETPGPAPDQNRSSLDHPFAAETWYVNKKMGASGIGRLLVASLHQAISELVPERLSFYEPWLTNDGVRITRVSLAGIRAAFSFLRREDGQYDPVMQRAGALSAQWIWQTVSAFRRGALRLLPVWLRRRVAASFARRVVSEAWCESRARVACRSGHAHVTVDNSLFCDVRTAQAGPLCTYYAAAFDEFLRLLDVEPGARIDACRGAGADRCEVVLPPTVKRQAGEVIGIALLIVAVLGSGGARAQSAPASVSPTSVLVMPFENASRDARLGWLTEGASLMVTERLRACGTDVLTRDDRLRVFERLQVPPLVNLSRATVIRLGQLVGARDVVTGNLRRDGDVLVLSARRTVLETGVMEPDVVVRTSASAVQDALEQLADRVVPSPRRATAGASLPQRPPLAAFEAYVRGLQAAAPAMQVTLLRQALAVSPSYDAPRLALWQVLTASGQPRAAADQVRAIPETSPQFADAQFLLGLSLLTQGQTADALAVWKSLHEQTPSAATLNNLGVAALREPSLASKAGKATWFFSQARAMDTLDPDYVFNLGYAYWTEGNPSGATYWLRECVRLDPTDGAAHALLARSLDAAGQSAEAYRELSLAQRLSSAFDDVVLKPGATAPRGLERLKESRDAGPMRLLHATVAQAGPQDQKEQAAFYRERGQRLADRELDLAAEAELRRALYFAPYDAASNLTLGQIYLRSGRLREAIDSVKLSLWSEESVAAHLVLAEAYLELRESTAAHLEAERALVLDPNSAQARKLLERLPR